MTDADEMPATSPASTGRGPAPHDDRRGLRAVALLLVVASVWILRPVLAPLLAAAFVVLVTQHPYERMVRALGGRRALASMLATAAITILVLAPIGAALYLAVRDALDTGQSIASAASANGGVGALVAKLPASLRDKLPSAMEAVDAVGALARAIAAAAPRVLGSVGWLVAKTVIAIASMYYLFAEGPTFVGFLRRVSPLRDDETDALFTEFRSVANALFRGNLVVMLFQGVVAGIGYAIFGVGDVFLLAAATMIMSLVPIVGTALVWLPLVVNLASTHRVSAAIGLAAWCAILVATCDNVLRPFVSRGHMALPRLLLLLMLVGGLEAFGIKGLLLGPLIGSLAVTALRLSQRRQEGLARSPNL